jgi:hypothetical protein
MDSNFYQFQLGLLAVICVILLAFERYLKSRKPPPDHLKEDPAIEDSLEVGHSVLHTNGTALSMNNNSRAGALNTLMRKYLLVYAIVMGRYARSIDTVRALIPLKVPIGCKAHTSTHFTASNMTSPNGSLQSFL